MAGHNPEGGPPPEGIEAAADPTYPIDSTAVLTDVDGAAAASDAVCEGAGCASSSSAVPPQAVSASTGGMAGHNPEGGPPPEGIEAAADPTYPIDSTAVHGAAAASDAVCEGAGCASSSSAVPPQAVSASMLAGRAQSRGRAPARGHRGRSRSHLSDRLDGGSHR
jgi:hypothetical protein